MKRKHKNNRRPAAPRGKTASRPHPRPPSLMSRPPISSAETIALARSRLRDCNRLITHVVQTMPDSFPGRTHLLESLVRLVPASHPRHLELIQTVNHLYQHIIAARDLAVILEEQ